MVTNACFFASSPPTLRAEETATKAGPAGQELSLEVAAHRLAQILTGASLLMADSEGSPLEFEADLEFRPLDRRGWPEQVWAVDGGQALVVDAGCLQVVLTRVSRVSFRHGQLVSEEAGQIAAHVIGGGEERKSIDALGLGVSPHASLEGADHLLRDGAEWLAVARCVEEADRGAFVLVDGDLQPDWRIPSRFLSDLFSKAKTRGVVILGVTKRSSLARGGAPLVGQLEAEASLSLGRRSLWWVPVARLRNDVGEGGIRVAVARLDPDAPFAFRIDVSPGVDPDQSLAALSAVSDDAAFPGYPYPLNLADRLAACPGWLRDEVRFRLDDLLDRAGVDYEVRQRAFADRHHLMERP